MIQLFNTPSYIIDTGKFSNLLHDKIVREFEEQFAEYVGAKYAVSFNSATSALFLIFKYLCPGSKIKIPSMIPPVVANAVITAGRRLEFTDNVNWVGDSYEIDFSNRFANPYQIIDSAQKVERNQFKNFIPNSSLLTPLMVFSFYPTKPVGSCDGGMVVSDNKDVIEYLRMLSFNGMSFAENNWDREIKQPGYKMYMNSIQAYIANKNLNRLDDKKEILGLIRDEYNGVLGLSNTSDHLYRISVECPESFIKLAKENGIVCGIHYKALHLNPNYSFYDRQDSMNDSEFYSSCTVSIPFNESLTRSEAERVIEFVLFDRKMTDGYN